MPDTNDFRFVSFPIFFSICPCENKVKQLFLLILKIATQRVRAQVCNLNHACQFTVNKKRSFNDMFYVSPQGSIRMEFFHQGRMFSANSFVIVVN